MNPPIRTENTETRTAQAYERLRPELAALRPEDLQLANVHPVKTAQKVLSRLPPLRALAGDLRRALPTFDQSIFDKLEDCALVLIATHARTVAAEAEGDSSRVLPQATKLRKVLVADAAALCARGYLKPSQLSKVTCNTGYESTARDLETLSSFLRRALPHITGKSAVTLGDIELAATLSVQLRLVVESRNQVSPSLVAPKDERTRVFTLLFRWYAEVRRTIGYLRAAEGDVDALVPQLRGRPYPARVRRAN